MTDAIVIAAGNLVIATVLFAWSRHESWTRWANEYVYWKARADQWEASARAMTSHLETAPTNAPEALTSMLAMHVQHDGDAGKRARRVSKSSARRIPQCLRNRYIDRAARVSRGAP